MLEVEVVKVVVLGGSGGGGARYRCITMVRHGGASIMRDDLASCSMMMHSATKQVGASLFRLKLCPTSAHMEPWKAHREPRERTSRHHAVVRVFFRSICRRP